MKLVTTTLLIFVLGFFGTLPAQQDLNLVGSHLDCWGTITSAYLIDRTAYISTSNLGLLIYNLEDLSQPVRVSRNRQLHLSHLGEWNGYLTGLTGNRLVFVDVSNPQEPQLAGSIEASNVASYTFSDTLCFISTYFSELISDPGYGTYGSVSFSILSIADVHQPSLRYREEHSWGPGAQDSGIFVDVGFSHMAFERNYLYATNEDGATKVWDTHEADTLVFASELDSYGSQALLIQDEHLFNIQSRSITIYGLDDPTSPDSLSSILFDSYSDCLIQDTLLYQISSVDSTLRTLDISNFEQPEQIGTMQLSSCSSGGLVISQEAGIVLTDNGSKAEILDLTNLTEPEVASELGEPKSITRIWKFDDLLFTYVDGQGLIISDCTERASPVEVAMLDLERVLSIKMRDFYALIGEGVNLKVFDVSTPSEPQHISTTVFQHSINDFDLIGDALFVTGWPAGLVLYNIEDISRPRRIATLMNEQVTKLQQIDTLLIALGEHSASIFTISNPLAPRLIAPYQREIREGEYATDMLAIDRTLLVFRYFNPSEDIYPPITDVVDISQPDSARLIWTHYSGSFETQPGYPLNINGRLGMVFGDALYIYSLHEFHHYGPHAYASYRLQPYARGAAIFDDDYLYVSTPGAIDIYDARSLGVKVEDHTTPSALSLSAFPNPFNSSVTISFSLSSSSSSLRIYDLSGRLVADLTEQSKIQNLKSKIGKVVWDAGSVGAGVYFVRLESGEEVISRKIVVIK